ncbi:hypothetical protein JOB18_034471 [Solea senegalensis]|uniref:Coiled-coil protein 142 C-terminal domain-containing protein n=2 Tax=Solea senegalensis TaxID=28829 RepID=A0AAV6SNB2_SOLSE|nr:hypothetical protein JOB18_034471 [Solea senegalensis]
MTSYNGIPYLSYGKSYHHKNVGRILSLCPDKEQGRYLVTHVVTANGSWSQRLQRAEILLRSTFNPSLKWLFHGRSQEEDNDTEEGNFVIAHNLMSRSSARLLRLQQALLTVAPQWQMVSQTQPGSPLVCVKGLPAESDFLPSSCSLLQGHYRTLWRLLEQRSLLLFIHEYTRRARLTAAFLSRVRHLLEEQIPSTWSSFRVSLGSLSQELRVHLNHWPCLLSKINSDQYLKCALVQHTRMLLEIKQTMDLLGLQMLVLMERVIYVLLSAIAQNELHSVPRDVLEDILAGTDVYNQAVEEHRVQHSSTQLRTAVLHQAAYSILHSGLPNSKKHHPAAFSVKELARTLAVHHAEKAAKQLCWASAQSCQVCLLHNNHESHFTLRSEQTWEHLQHTNLMSSPHFSVDQILYLKSSMHCACHETPLYVPDLYPDHHLLFSEFPSVQHKTACSNRDQTSQRQTHLTQIGRVQTSMEGLDFTQPKAERWGSLENKSNTTNQLSGLPLSAVGQSSVELLFQLLVSSHMSTPEAPPEQLLPNTRTDESSPNRKTEMKRLSAEPNKDQNMERSPLEWTEVKTRTRLEVSASSGDQMSVDPEKAETLRGDTTTQESDNVLCPHTVQWLDLGQSLVFADVIGQYRTMLWALCCKALWLQMYAPQAANMAESLNLQDKHRSLQMLHLISQTSETDVIPKESRALQEDFNLNLIVSTTYAHWDYVFCRGLGSSLKDKCLTNANQVRCSETSESKQDGSVMMSATMEHFLLLLRLLLSSQCCHCSDREVSGSFTLLPSNFSLQRQAVNLALATVQLATVWVTYKAQHFLSSWSLNKFLLIIQGDLKVLIKSSEMLLHQIKSVMTNSDSDHQSAFHNHNHLLLKQQLKALDRAVSELQTFSSLVLNTFSSDCKRKSGEIFEQTMPSSAHWRPSHRTGFPSSPSEYASLAAQTVIGQVLEGVAPLPNDARVQALSITTTAFLEAWMEHILKQRIRFNVQGALQLKQDFDSIRELLQSEEYGLSAELHQQLLSLRVFQQVDSAMMCLLQQPQAKPYLQSRTWEPFTRCCPARSSSDSIDAAVGSSITNLRSMEGEELTQSDPSVGTTELNPVNTSAPGEPYLAPSLALGAAQQEWLDLRIHSNVRRWRLPGLQCLSKSEP